MHQLCELCTNHHHLSAGQLRSANPISLKRTHWGNRHGQLTFEDQRPYHHRERLLTNAAATPVSTPSNRGGMPTKLNRYFDRLWYSALARFYRSSVLLLSLMASLNTSVICAATTKSERNAINLDRAEGKGASLAPWVLHSQHPQERGVRPRVENHSQRQSPRRSACGSLKSDCARDKLDEL